jgi:hypothetical protein
MSLHLYTTSEFVDHRLSLCDYSSEIKSRKKETGLSPDAPVIRRQAKGEIA